jgi:hypothetical protein
MVQGGFGAQRAAPGGRGRSVNRRWIAIGGVVLLVVLVGLGGAIALGGGDTISTTATTTTASTLAPATLPPATTASTPSVTIGIICSVPQDAATTLVNAWIAGDQAAASRCATSSAVSTLFQNRGAGAQWMFQGCNGSNDPGVPICQYSYEGGAANLTLNGTEAAGWKVVSIGYIAD